MDICNQWRQKMQSPETGSGSDMQICPPSTIFGKYPLDESETDECLQRLGQKCPSIPSVSKQFTACQAVSLRVYIVVSYSLDKP